MKKHELLIKQIPDSATSPEVVKNLQTGITDLLSNLVTGTFIIEKQPPQVFRMILCEIFYILCNV